MEKSGGSTWYTSWRMMTRLNQLYPWNDSLLRTRLSGCHATLLRKEWERCVTSRKTAAKETKGMIVVIRYFGTFP